jgi:hypothetical protein
MGLGQQNPLVPPPIPADVTPQLPAPSKRPWSSSDIFQGIIGTLLLAFAILQSTPTIQSLLPHSAQSGIYALVFFGALGVLLLAVTLARAFKRRLLKRKARESDSATPGRVTELAVLVGKARRTWSASSNYIGSFEQGATSILNSLNSAPGQSVQIPEERRRAADRANFLFYGWRASSATQDAVFWELDRLLDDLRTTDRATFLTALLLLRQVMLGSIQVASSFADEVRRSEPTLIQEYCRQAWSDFRERASALSEEVTTLGEKTKRDYRRADLTFFFPSVHDVQT